MAIAGEFGLDLTPEGRAALSMLDELEDIVVEVGYQADQMAIDGETSLAEIAYWNHYGTLHKDGSVMIPARPFTDALQKHPDELAEFSHQAASNLNTAETVASAIGAQASSMIQDAIRDEDWTPNAPITVDGGWMVNEYGKKMDLSQSILTEKALQKPLIDTGTMRQQCGFRLVKGEK